MKIAVASGVLLISIMYYVVSKTLKPVQQLAMWYFYTLAVTVSFCNYIRTCAALMIRLV